MLFLLPPSEGKKQGGSLNESTVKRDLPISIAVGATPKDLKCSGKRYEEGIMLNGLVTEGPFMKAIERYTGVMFKAVGYELLSEKAQEYFDNHIRIFSGLYGRLHPTDSIANYKLPADTKGLRVFWGNYFIKALQGEKTVIDLLPGAHKKYIDFKSLKTTTTVHHVDFFYEGKKMTHGVKGAKGYRLGLVCEIGSDSIDSWPMSFDYKGKMITVSIT